MSLNDCFKVGVARVDRKGLKRCRQLLLVSRDGAQMQMVGEKSAGVYRTILPYDQFLRTMDLLLPGIPT